MHGVTLLLRNPVQMYLSSVFLMHMHVHAYPSLFKKFCEILMYIFSICWVVSLIFNQIGIWIWGIKLVILGTSLDNAPPTRVSMVNHTVFSSTKLNYHLLLINGRIPPRNS